MMKAGNELDALIAKEVFEFTVTEMNGRYFESTREWTRELRPYSTEISAAWEVAEKLGITLIPVASRSWFALVSPDKGPERGQERGWKSPNELIEYIQTADFVRSGAAVTESASLSICMAALKAVEKRKAASSSAHPLERIEPSSPVRH